MMIAGRPAAEPDLRHSCEEDSAIDMQYVFRYRAVAEALYDALTDDAFYIAMEASVPEAPQRRREAMLRYFDYAMQEGERYGELCVCGDPSLGASIWSKPVSDQRSVRMMDEKQAFLKAHLGPASLDKYQAITKLMAKRTHAVIQPGSWYLSIVGVAPRFQGNGMGVTLIRPILDRMDQLGCPAYLETFTPRNKPFYRRLGFQDRGAFDVPSIGSRYWVMVRDPSKG